jgi:hypothetical protein
VEDEAAERCVDRLWEATGGEDMVSVQTFALALQLGPSSPRDQLSLEKAVGWLCHCCTRVMLSLSSLYRGILCILAKGSLKPDAVSPWCCSEVSVHVMLRNLGDDCRLFGF